MARDNHDDPLLEAAFRQVFGLSLDEGRGVLRYLVRNAITFEKFSKGVAFDRSRITMTETDFALVAFFACVGAGELEGLGIPALPDQIEIEAVNVGERPEGPTAPVDLGHGVTLESRDPGPDDLELPEVPRGVTVRISRPWVRVDEDGTPVLEASDPDPTVERKPVVYEADMLDPAEDFKPRSDD